MESLQPTAKTVNLLKPSQAQQKAWQLLGYKRYIPRCDLRSTLKTPSLISSSVEKTSAFNTELPTLKETTIFAQEREVLRLSDVTIVDCMDFTLLYRQKSELLLCFPALWFVDARWQLFIHEDEWDLLLCATQTIGLEGLVSLLQAVRVGEFLSPRFNTLPQEVIADLGIAKKHIVYFGTDALKADAGAYFSAANITWVKTWECVHPYLAMQSAQEKRQFWHDLLALKKELRVYE